MSLSRSYIAVLIWLLICAAATGVIAHSDFKAEQGKHHLDMVRELSKSRSVIEESVNRYFTLVNALEAFVQANKDIYHASDDLDTEFGQRFQRFAAALERSNKSTISLQLAPAGIVTFVSKVEKNAEAIGHDLLKDDKRRKQVIRTIINKTTVVAGPLTLIQGGNALIARKAIFTDPGVYLPEQLINSQRAPNGASWPNEIPDNFWGFATMLIDTDLLFKEFGLDNLPSDYQFALRGRHGLGDKGDVFWGDKRVFDNPEYLDNISLPGGSWVMGIKNTSHQHASRFAAIILTGTIISVLGIYVFYARQKKLVAEAEAKTHNRFLATMSHEIRTPMNGIIGVAEVMKNTKLTATQQSHLDKILGNSKLLLRLVNDILDFSKIDSGALVLERKPFSPQSVLRSALHTVEKQAELKGIPINITIAASAPDVIKGDETRLQQILVNLLSNAVKFTEKGIIDVTMDLINIDSSPYLAFRVEDTGIGMSESALNIIFNPFTQADQSITRKFGGTGLGLVICDKLVSLMGGEISVKSKQGVGSTFQVLIPYHPVETSKEDTKNESTDEISHSPEAEQLTTKAAEADLKILIVDDQKMNIEVATMILEELGYRCEGVTNGQEAIDAMEAGHYDIIYMDRQMPGMDGLEATRIIRQQTNSHSFPWIIALTASAQEEEREEYLAAGANDFLSKPVDIESFAGSIQKYLHHIGR